jgi:hypothetical protein
MTKQWLYQCGNTFNESPCDGKTKIDIMPHAGIAPDSTGIIGATNGHIDTLHYEISDKGVQRSTSMTMANNSVTTEPVGLNAVEKGGFGETIQQKASHELARQLTKCKITP